MMQQPPKKLSYIDAHAHIHLTMERLKVETYEEFQVRQNLLFPRVPLTCGDRM